MFKIEPKEEDSEKFINGLKQGIEIVKQQYKTKQETLMERDFKTNECLKQNAELCRANLAIALLSMVEDADAHFIHFYDILIDKHSTLARRHDAFVNITRNMSDDKKKELVGLLDNLDTAIENYNGK